jgi:hypothetical protein
MPPRYTEEALQLALKAIKSRTSTHQASKDYRILRTTIIRRLQGAQTRTENARD